jgi:hypothetical protein
MEPKPKGVGIECEEVEEKLEGDEDKFKEDEQDKGSKEPEEEPKEAK